MIRKILNISFWSGLILGVVFLLGFTGKNQSGLVCEKIAVEIDYSNNMFFLKNEDVFEQLKQTGNYPVGRMMREIRLREIEKILVSIPEVKSAEVYKTINGTIGIRIKQRTPIVRVININGKSFFIDNEGYQMEVTGKYYPRLLVVNGFISEPMIESSALEIEKDSALKSRFKIDDIFNMASFIQKSSFWNSQIQEIYFNNEGEMELIPVVGQHRIIFGNSEHLEEKFNKLYVFYKKGLRKTGWNKYDIINLKYKNQVVCRKIEADVP